MVGRRVMGAREGGRGARALALAPQTRSCLQNSAGGGAVADQHQHVVRTAISIICRILKS